MGKETASAFGRWFVLKDFPVNVSLVAVCDTNEQVLEWFRQVPTVSYLTTDYRELLANKDIDVVYVAVPHHLHEKIYIEVMESGKDLLGEKPFGLNTEASAHIRMTAERLNRFARCSSEFPFLPGSQKLIADVRSGKLGRIMEVKAGFLHSSDMDPMKPLNWKRQVKYCGETGVMGDLGMHVLHIPLRLGWKPSVLFAQLQKIITKRPDGQNGWAESDTWNNATLFTKVRIENYDVPMSLEMKRLSPGENNTWFIEVYGTEGAVKYSTKDAKAYWRYNRASGNGWLRTDLGFSDMQFPVITGDIFEIGFPDCFMQMLAAFVAEREGLLERKFGCVTPEEAEISHMIFMSALRSASNLSAEKINPVLSI